MFQVIRANKLKTRREITGSANHTFREKRTENADPSRLKFNQHVYSKNTAALNENFEARLKKVLDDGAKKERKNGVLLIEYLITASPEFFKTNDGDKYFNDSVKWLKKRHGSDNVIGVSVHRDETSPHLVAYVIPESNGKMNCRAYLGGIKKLQEMQTDFNVEVGIKHELERGKPKAETRATHTKIKDFYVALNQPDAVIEAPKMFESGEKYIKKLGSKIKLMKAKSVQFDLLNHVQKQNDLLMPKHKIALEELEKFKQKDRDKKMDIDQLKLQLKDSIKQSMQLIRLLPKELLAKIAKNFQLDESKDLISQLEKKEVFFGNEKRKYRLDEVVSAISQTAEKIQIGYKSDTTKVQTEYNFNN